MKKSKTEVIVADEHDYTFKEKVTEEKRTYKLIRSKNPLWTNKEEKVIKIVDDGNGIKINDQHYEYHEVHELFIALKALIKVQEGEWPKVKLIK